MKTTILLLSIVFISACTVAPSVSDHAEDRKVITPIADSNSKPSFNPKASALIKSRIAPRDQKEDSILSVFVINAQQYPYTSYEPPMEDNRDIKNIARPNRSYIVDFNRYPINSNPLGLWCIPFNDAKLSILDFMINDYYFFPRAYEGDQGMPYIIVKDSLFVYYPDFLRQGKITKVSSDTLAIFWKGYKSPIIYTKGYLEE